MKKRSYLKLILFLLMSGYIFSCNTSNKEREPSIKAGTAKITGQIINYTKESCYIYISVNNPITGVNRYKTLVDKAGYFTIEVDTETNLALCSVYSDINLYKSLFVLLKEGRETKIEITYNINDEVENVEITKGFMLSNDDIIYSFDVMFEMIDFRSDRPREQLYNKSFDHFLDHANNVLQERLSIVYGDSCLSKNTKNILAKDYTILLYGTHVLDYKDEMRLNYTNTNDGQFPDSSEIQTPTKQYYAFLKKLNLNDSQYLYCFSVSEFVKNILQNETLNIPPISETPIDIWLQQVKTILSDLVGFDKGLFYDVLVGNAYGRQLNNELKPLSDTQIENIKKYYKGREIEKILLRKNEEVIKLAREKGNVVVNDTPKESKEKIMDAILSKYKGKIVVVDLWATWCGPCIQAMKDSREIKKELNAKDVVFVYITNPSSPNKLWKEQVEGIGGEHYYLTGEEWEYIMDSFNLSGIPSYLIYDKSSILKEKITGYPGNEEMKRKIEDIVKE